MTEILTYKMIDGVEHNVWAEHAHDGFGRPCTWIRARHPRTDVLLQAVHADGWLQKDEVHAALSGRLGS